MRKLTTLLTALAFVGAPVSAFAASDNIANCACTTAQKSAGAAIGTINKTSGKVLYTGTTGFVDATSGSKLMAGSQISTGSGSSADISVGATCNLSIPENSEVSILPVNGVGSDICLQVTSEYGQAATGTAGGVSPAVIGAVVVGGIGIGVFIAGSNSKASD